MALTMPRVALIGAGVTVGFWLLLEAVSISEWTAANVPLDGQVGILRYRETWGEMNRVTMRINEGLLWLCGYEMTGSASYGHLGVWMHTYQKR